MLGAASTHQQVAPVASLAAIGPVLRVSGNQEWVSLPALTFLFPLEVGLSLPEVHSNQRPLVFWYVLFLNQPTPGFLQSSALLFLPSVPSLQLCPAVPLDWNIRLDTTEEV